MKSSLDVPAQPSRRQLLAGLAGLVGVAGGVAACSQTAAPTSPASSAAASPTAATPVPTPARTITPAPTAKPARALPPTTPWTARAGEVRPDVKAVAVDLLQTVGAWSEGGGGTSAAAARLTKAGFDPALAQSMPGLVTNDPAAALQVVDAQYGGILTSSSSVLVVVDQWLRHADGSISPGGTTVDVRLVEASPRWRIVEVLPAKPGGRVATTSLSPLARAVLGNSRIRLPYAARADIEAGGIVDSVLRTLTSLSTLHVVDVSIVRSGHPIDVFGTDRPSDHPKGRAVDVWALDGAALVEPDHLALAEQAMRLAVSLGAYNVGGPVLLNGSQYFSDLTHHDHVHLGFQG